MERKGPDEIFEGKRVHHFDLPYQYCIRICSRSYVRLTIENPLYKALHKNMQFPILELKEDSWKKKMKMNYVPRVIYCDVPKALFSQVLQVSWGNIVGNGLLLIWLEPQQIFQVSCVLFGNGKRLNR